MATLTQDINKVQEYIFTLRSKQSECPLSERANIQHQIMVAIALLDKLTALLRGSK